MAGKLENTVEKLIEQCIDGKGLFKIKISGTNYCPLCRMKEVSEQCPYISKEGAFLDNLYKCTYDNMNLILKVNKDKKKD